MTSLEQDGGGSFRELRTKHLPMFDESLHRHDRGWPHPELSKEELQTKRRWRIFGILHIPHHEEGDS